MGQTYNLKRVGGGCNRVIYTLKESSKDQNHRRLDLHKPDLGIVYKVNRKSIPPSQAKEMLECLKLLKDYYTLLRDLGHSKGLNIAPFDIELIEDKNKNLRLVYAEPNIPGIFKDDRVIDLSHANTHSNPQKILIDDQALNSLSNIVDLCKEFHAETKKDGRSMYPDIWGENNILGIKNNAVFNDHALKQDSSPSNTGYPLFGTSSLIKLNGPKRLFNQRPDFQLVIAHVLDSMQRLVDQRGKNTEERILRPTPMESVLFFLADTKTQMSKAGINF